MEMERQSFPPSTTSTTATRLVPFLSFSMRMQESAQDALKEPFSCVALTPQAAHYPNI